MSDFAKAKIIFALALTGVLFAIHPLIRDFGSEGYSFFGTLIPFRMLYYTLMGLLACAIYFYAVDFITDNPLGMAHRIGNLFYAMALLFPPVFAIVALSVNVAEGVVWMSNSAMAGEISKMALTLIATSAGLLLARVASRQMTLRDRSESVSVLEIRSKDHLGRAQEMLDSGHYDLVALESFRCLESVLQGALLEAEITVPNSRANQLIPIAARAGLIPDELVGVFHELRVARNRAVHTVDDFDKKDATWFLDTTKRIVSSVRHQRPGPAPSPAKTEELLPVGQN